MPAADARRSAAFGAASALAFALSFPLSAEFTAGWPLAFAWPALFAAAVWCAPRPITLLWTIGVPFFLAFLAHQWWMRHITELGMPVLVAYLAAWTVVLAIWLRRLAVAAPSRPRWPFALALPLALVSVEYLRGSLVCSGYAWFFAAHPLVEWITVAQVAALGGGWLLTALAGFVAGACVDAFVQGGRRRFVWPAAAALALAGSFLYGRSQLAARDADAPAQAAPRILVVQTDLPMSNKLAWPPEEQERDFLAFARLSLEGADAAGGPVDLVLWPETMLPGLGLEPDSLEALERGRYYPGRRYDEALRDLSRRVGAPLLVGSPAYLGLRVEGNRFAWDRQFNSAYLVGKDGVAGRTDKIYLTPFGETMPIISNWDWLEAQLLALGAEGMTFDLDHAEAPVSFSVPSSSGAAAATIAVPICFEITQPWVARRIVFPDGARAAGVAVNLSNDGWFGGSRAGRRQHLQVAQLRAIELRTPVVRCVNTGMSAEVDACGRVVRALGPEEAGAFVASPLPGEDRPLAVLVGD
ncbi:MAG: hypothetical protein RL325_208, partial [Planctomycetota bacterium]